MSYVYIQSETPSVDTPGLWTVGFYRPDGTWEPESDHPSAQAAAGRARWLNGGPSHTERAALERVLKRRLQMIETASTDENAHEYRAWMHGALHYATAIDVIAIGEIGPWMRQAGAADQRRIDRRPT